jgi:hypothetical protein
MELSGMNQLWVAAIAYIRLETEFVYLTSRGHRRFFTPVVGWPLDRSLEDDLPLTALRKAFEQRSPASALVHHSDRAAVH